ncbi:hypothetical protein MIR68_003091 [Amoeboaphelidium protococcarum]|nr:hypothetical protein MIR68_003091 [Amoeboaphelidium protococcarum]
MKFCIVIATIAAAMVSAQAPSDPVASVVSEVVSFTPSDAVVVSTAVVEASSVVTSVATLPDIASTVVTSEVVVSTSTVNAVETSATSIIASTSTVFDSTTVTSIVGTTETALTATTIFTTITPSTTTVDVLPSVIPTDVVVVFNGAPINNVQPQTSSTVILPTPFRRAAGHALSGSVFAAGAGILGALALI